VGPLRVANRVLSFGYKRFDGQVPEPGDPSNPSGQGLDDEDRALLEKVEPASRPSATCTPPASSAPP
jgi:hypothetical protein